MRRMTPVAAEAPATPPGTSLLNDIMVGLREVYEVPPTDRISLLSAIANMVALRVGFFRLSPQDFVYFRLYERHFSWRQRREFFSDWAHDIVYRHLDPRQMAIAYTKAQTSAILRDAGLSCPRTLAIIGGATGADPSVRHLTTAQATVEFLAVPDRYPLFVKPDFGMHGEAAALIRGTDPAGGLRLGDGSVIAVNAFAEGLLRRNAPFVVQTAVVPHAHIAAVTAGKLASNRLQVLVSDGEVVFHRAVVRIPVGKAMVDNFDGGRTGNIVGDVDVETGRVRRVITGTGRTLRVLDRHPDTGVSFKDWTMPRWAEARELIGRAARLFPGVPIQAWDFGIGEAGPEILELNPRGQVKMIQLAGGRGVGDAAFRAHLARLRREAEATGHRPIA